MPITIKIGNTEHQLATTDDLLAVENFVSETQAQASNAAEQVRLLQAQHTKLSATVKEILAGNATSTEPDPIIIEDDSEPVYDGIIVGPDDNLQEAILDAGGQQIWLKDGDYKPFEVVSDTRIKAMSKHAAVVSGLIPYDTGWVKSGTAWYKDLDTPMYQHPANAVHSENGAPSQRGLAHRRAMQPHMLVWGEDPMQPVYNAGDLLPGTFLLEGTAENPKGFWARFPEDQAPAEGSVFFSPYQYLIRGKNGDVDGVELDGLSVRYCSNTGTFGAIQMEMGQEYWKLLNLSVTDSMSEGIRLRGSNHLVQSSSFDNHGHVGIAGQGLFRSQLIDCSADFNVWRYGVDPLWHAGGLKWQYGCNENMVKNYSAEGNNGAGFWLDIWNVNNVVDGFELVDNSTFGMHIEHNSRGTIAKNGYIKGTRTFHGGQHPNGSGLQIQGAIFDCHFNNIILEGNEDGAVYYKKSGDHRGDSGGNTFEQIAHRNNGNNNRWVIQGDMNKDPDTYLRMSAPDITNWT